MRSSGRHRGPSGLAPLIFLFSMLALPTTASADKLTLRHHCEVCSTRGTATCSGVLGHQRQYRYALAGESSSETSVSRYTTSWHLKLVDIEDDRVLVNVLLHAEHVLLGDDGPAHGDFHADYHEVVELQVGQEFRDTLELGTPEARLDFTLLYELEPEELTGSTPEYRPGTGPDQNHNCRFSAYELHHKFDVEPNDHLHHCFGEAIEAGEYEYYGDRRVFVHLSITPAGEIENVELSTPEYQGTGLESCLIELVNSVDFGPTLCDGTKSLFFPFAPDEYKLRRMGKWKTIPKEDPGEAPDIDMSGL